MTNVKTSSHGCRFQAGDRVRHIYCAARGEPASGTVTDIDGENYLVEWDDHPGMEPEPHACDELEPLVTCNERQSRS